MKKIFLLPFLLLLTVGMMAQELEVEVTINTPKLQTADPKVFADLEIAIEEFYNNRRWTEDVYDPQERIKCKIQLTIEEELSATSFRANMAILSSRPIYNSDTETTMLNHVDKDVIFDYEPLQPIVFSQNIFQDNLSSILGFYAYVILGLDYDSFAEFGGTEYFQIAQDIMTSIPQNATAKYPGWRQLDGNRNRYWIVQNVLSPRVRDYRQAMYEYHRLSLDTMVEDVTVGRDVMMKSLQKIGEVNRNYPNTMILQMFANAKRSELVEIFKNGDSAQKDQLFRIMVKMDAANASSYSKIRK